MMYFTDSIGRDGIYGGMLEMPRPVLLAVLWLAGAAIAGVCLLTLYLLAAMLVGA
jgi:hypothetical protein